MIFNKKTFIDELKIKIIDSWAKLDVVVPSLVIDSFLMGNDKKNFGHCKFRVNGLIIFAWARI